MESQQEGRLLHLCGTPGCANYLVDFMEEDEYGYSPETNIAFSFIDILCEECEPCYMDTDFRLTINEGIAAQFERIARGMRGFPYPYWRIPQFCLDLGAELPGPVPKSFDELVERLGEGNRFEAILKKFGTNIEDLLIDPGFDEEALFKHLRKEGLATPLLPERYDEELDDHSDGE